MRQAAMFSRRGSHRRERAPMTTRSRRPRGRPMRTSSLFVYRKGYDTKVGERGVKLSGGQRQRLAIARIFLKDPALVILDEATSSLDSESERYVEAAMEELLRGRSTLIIAHRFSTVLRSDRVVVLEHGRVIEEGTHARDLLAAEGGVYAKLYRGTVPPRRSRRPRADLIGEYYHLGVVRALLGVL